MKLQNFGKRLKRLRQSKRLTQSELGQLINLKQSQIDNLESGKTTPSVRTVVWISQKLAVNIDYLVYGERAQTLLNDTELLYLFKRLLVLDPNDNIDTDITSKDFGGEKQATMIV